MAFLIVFTDFFSRTDARYGADHWWTRGPRPAPFVDRSTCSRARQQAARLLAFGARVADELLRVCDVLAPCRSRHARGER